MSDTQEVKNLKAIREQWVEERRALAVGFKDSGDVEYLVAKIAQTQSEIDALDRAIEDEKRLRPGTVSVHPL